MSRRKRTDGVARLEEIRIDYRLLFAILGLLAGEAATAVLVGGQPLWAHFVIAVAIGWASVGLPIMLLLPS
ncbi:MAG: hypothetical protein H7039_06790 [Bryobacteraceae bacterium]|nr:hypothetical protein [Bryobacteraceae bacterium]